MDATDMDAREYEARGIQLSEKPHDRAGAERRARDFRTLAAMAEGAVGMQAARLELEQLDKELGDPDGLVLFDALGAVIAPDIIQGGAVYGRQPQVDLDLAEVKNW